MTKIVIVIFTVAAFCYAAFLVLANRQLPNPQYHNGARRRFILATLLFVGLMGTSAVTGREPGMMCYRMVPGSNQVSRHDLAAGLKAIWQTLDPKRSGEFRTKLAAAAGQGTIRRKTAAMLAIAYSELAYHQQTGAKESSKIPVLCYMRGPPFSQDWKHISTEEAAFKALKQLELLRNARQSGTIDPQTAAKAHAVLAREVQMLYQL